MWLALLLEVSLFVSPQYLGDTPPESRSARALVVAIPAAPPGAGAPKPEPPDSSHPDPARREQARREAQALADALRGGADFDALVQRAQALGPESGGGVLGTVFPGMLAPEVDGFLYSAQEFEVSAPIESRGTFQVVQRVERFAACRGILVAGHDEGARARIAALAERLRQGADFAELARECSEDKETAARGGALGIFERGPSDRLLKAAAFRLKLGEVGGPYESPLGLHLLRRVDPATLETNLADDTVARLSMMLISFRGARGAPAGLERTHADAEALAAELVRRLEAGESFAELAAAHDDDRGGRERRGDAGWVRRGSGQLAPVLDGVFFLRPGTLREPLATDAGYLILRRER